MIEGSGLRPLYNAMPERVHDVGIAEQHAVTFAGAMSAAGMIPYLCIYSTFLNRGIDQLIQDIALMNLPVRIVIDRAGCVGPDGETHQGLYDLGVLLSVPNIQVYVPLDARELQAMLYYMEDHNHSPIAIRFPKASSNSQELQGAAKEMMGFHERPPRLLGEGKDLAILVVGTMWETALAVREQMQRDTNLSNIGTRVLGLGWLRPLHQEVLEHHLSAVNSFVIIEDSYIHSSAAAYILQSLPSRLLSKHRRTFAFPELCIEHGKREDITHRYGLSPTAILESIAQLMK